eukprot:scaffold298_cov247-Pinguiococcus_pyrenoidosus.AAC.45
MAVVSNRGRALVEELWEDAAQVVDGVDDVVRMVRHFDRGGPPVARHGAAQNRIPTVLLRNSA